MKTQTQFPRTERGVTAGPSILGAVDQTEKNGSSALTPALSPREREGRLRPVLSNDERTRLADLEGTIRRGLDSFMEVAAALLEVRKDRLYRETSPTFEAYCEQRWEMTARRARQICAASQVVENLRLPENGSAAVLPATESQARPLTRLPEEEQRPAWDRAVRKAELMGSAVTAKIVESIVQEKIEAKKPKGLTAENAESTEGVGWPKPYEHGVYRVSDAETVRFNSSQAKVEIRLLQIWPQRWMGSTDYTLPDSGDLTPLKVGQGWFPTRAAALKEKAHELVMAMHRLIDGTGSKIQRSEAVRVREWAVELIEEIEGKKADLDEPPFVFGELKGTKDLPQQDTKVAKKAAEQFSMVTERAGQLSAGIRLYVKTIRELPGDLAQRFGQAVYHLDCARTELDRLALGGGKQKAESKKQKAKPTRGVSAASRALMTARARARWAKAKRGGRRS